MQRSARGLRFPDVRLCVSSGLRCLLLDRLPGVPFSWRRKSNRAADATLGRMAGRIAKSNGSGLVSYSYFGFDSITQYGSATMLFQVHPHPATVRQILNRELLEHPDCADSLRQEWELSLPEPDFQRLVCETRMASHYLVASSFTRASLIDHGTSPDAITVVPYGVDLERFHPAHGRRSTTGEPLRLLFVGRINQRKGIKYLLEAMQELNTDMVELTVCGRVVDDLQIFRDLGSRVKVRPSVSAEDLVVAYQNADLFVFPSVAEGFGQVLLEALACGLPILSTTHTAAPDLIADGVEGFIVAPRRTDLLIDRILWAIEHPAELAMMRSKARQCAEKFTWARFRHGVVEATRSYLTAASETNTAG
jgi:glycosyltransferase involved in cell wall biosynthesis